MLLVQREQMDRLGTQRRLEFEHRLAQHLRAAFPGVVERKADDALLETVRSGCRTGARFGIVQQDDLRRLLEFLMTHDQAIRSDDRVRDEVMAILGRQDIDGTRKMDALDRLDLRLAGAVG